MSKVTEEEAKAAGIPIELMQQWDDLMQALWSDSIKQFRKGICPQPINGENEILLGDKYRIRTMIVNNKYLEVELYQGETELASFRHMGYAMPISISIFSIITFMEHAS